MRRVAAIAALVVLAATAAAAAPPVQAARSPGASRILPIAVRPVGEAVALPAPGTDGMVHALYELSVVNTSTVPIAIRRVEIRTLAPTRVIDAFDGDALVTRLRRVDGSPLSEPVVAPREQLFLFVDLALFPAVELPVVVDHSVSVGDRVFKVARVAIEAIDPVAIAPPVSGRSWVVTEGCCGPQSTHRTTVYPTELGYSTPGRFAMHLVQMDEQGRFITGDPAALTSYPAYGQSVKAVSAGRVVAVVDGFPDHVPGTAPPPGTVDPEAAEGNFVVVDMGAGGYAFYGGLRPGSIIVTPRTYVRRGQPIAELGNSAAGPLPHLHLEVLSSPERIGADGMPFVFTGFGYSGRIEPERLAARGLAGSFADSRLTIPQPRATQLPLGLSILDFESRSGGTGNPLL
jgi:hypothetical protein